MSFCKQSVTYMYTILVNFRLEIFQDWHSENPDTIYHKYSECEQNYNLCRRKVKKGIWKIRVKLL